MNIKKTYIPAKFRNPKLVNSGGSNTTVQGGGSSTEGHTHNNKPVIDQLTQADINVLAKLSLVDGNLKVDTNLYSTKELSAYGLGEGSGGGGGGSDYERLDTWASYDSSKAEWVLSAFLGNDLNTRVTSLEQSGGGGGEILSFVTSGTGNAVTSIAKSGTVVTAYKNGSFLPLTGGTLTGNINITPIEGTLGVRTHRVGASGYMWPYGSSLSNIRTGLGFGWRDTEWIIGNIRGDSIDSYGFGIGYRNADGNLNGEFRIAVGGIAYLNNVRIATRSTTLAGYGITDAYTKTEVNSALNLKANLANPTFTGNIVTSGNILTTGLYLNIGKQINAYSAVRTELALINPNAEPSMFILGSDGVRKWSVETRGIADNYALSIYTWSNAAHVLRILNNGNVGIGTTNPLYKLDVLGTGRFTGNVTSPKVIFNAAGWSMEQVGSELQLKYNNLIASRFLSDGSIVGLGEITAYGATTGGEGVALLRSGGTMTGNLTMSADIIMNSGRAIGISNLPLKLLGNALTYNASNILTEANTANQIKMGNGWTIEQTTASLTIRRNGVIKGTFNA